MTKNTNIIINNIEKFTNVNSTKSVDDEGTTWIPCNIDESAELGVFDKLLQTATVNLDAQFKSKRIRQENYAQAYVQMYQTTLQAAMQYFMQKDLVNEQIESENKKQELLERQKTGYDEDYMLKSSSMILDGYNVFLTTQPNVEQQGYPVAYVGEGNYDLDYSNQKYDKNEANNKPFKLRFIDGLLGDMIKRHKAYSEEGPTTSFPSEELLPNDKKSDKK